ncbi:MAG: hypothetical protein HY655_06935 [Acidobacteria bacterium]|nr:hypothetical protein [Acidobacteriota bacterium]
MGLSSLVGEKRLAVLDRDTWAFKRSIALRGHPVYAVWAPGERHVWVTFSGEADDAFVQVVDVGSLDDARSRSANFHSTYEIVRTAY